MRTLRSSAVDRKATAKTAAGSRVLVVPMKMMELLRVGIAAFHTEPDSGTVDHTARLVPGIQHLNSVRSEAGRSTPHPRVPQPDPRRAGQRNRPPQRDRERWPALVLDRPEREKQRNVPPLVVRTGRPRGSRLPQKLESEPCVLER